MTSKIKIPVRQLDAQIVKDLQEKYPNAEISIDIHEAKKKLVLSDNEFWEMIQLIDWEKKNDENKLKPLLIKLQKSSIRKIYDFADLLSEYLYKLDGKKFAKEIGVDAWKNNTAYFSVDNFLYARLCVIANGKSFYDKVLKGPAKMPVDLTFEDLLYVASEAYQNKVGKSFDYSSRFPIETYGNEKGWK